MTTQQEQIEATAWRLLRAVYIRLCAEVGEGKPVQHYTEAEQQLLIDPYVRMLEHDHRLIVECIRQARGAGIRDVQAALHKAEGTDHAMVDQAVEYAMQRQREEGGR